MSNFMEIIHSRRSIRRYLPKEISDETMQTVLEAARWAPSWANTQCWDLVLVSDQELKKDLQGTISDRNPSTNALVDAPVLIALCGKLKSSGYYKESTPTKFGDWFMFDLGIMCQTICLAAHTAGLGTVVVGLFDQDKAGEIIGIPEGHEVVALIPMGYSDQQPSPPKRKEVADFCHHNTFGNKR
jgi:nitroreductase